MNDRTPSTYDQYVPVVTQRPTLMVIGYPTRLVQDHEALLAAADAAGFDATIVNPGRLGLVVSDEGEEVLVDGRAIRPDVVLPRGVNRPWPFIRQVLDVWQRQGVEIVPSLAAADVCADKLATTRCLAAAGVPMLPTIGVAPDTGVRLTPLEEHVPLIAKPARASKGRGVERHNAIETAEAELGVTRPLHDDMVDHHVVQPLATGWGVDYRVVVAAANGARYVVAATERRAPDGTVVTNADGSTVRDITDAARTHPDVVEVAIAAADALGLDFGGIDVIRHHDRPVVLEVNAWPGLAAAVRGPELASALIATVLDRLGSATPSGVATSDADR